MTTTAPFLLSALLLFLPWLMRPRPGPRPEIRGVLRPLWWIVRAYCFFFHRLETEQAPLPSSGPAILIANHTSGIDFFVLQAGCRRVLGFMILQDWYDQRVVHPFCKLIGCIPVKRDGRDLGATRAGLRALANGRVVPLFPEGRINPHSGRDFLEARPGVAFLALHAKVPVIPAYISGTPPTSDVWRALATPSASRVVYGPPIDLSDLDDEPAGRREALALATDRLMGAIRELRDRKLIYNK